MKKIFICVSVVGLATGIVYWLCKREKSNNNESRSLNKKREFDFKAQEEEWTQNSNTEEEMYNVKSESAQAIHDRHSEASSIMKDVYSNIMEDFVEDFSGGSSKNEKENNEEVSVASETVSVMKEIDWISNELDELLM